VRFESAVKGSTAAGLRASFLCRVVHGFRIHRHEITVGRVPGVSEQWVSFIKWWQSIRKQSPRATLTGVERVNVSQQIVESEIGRPRSCNPTITSRRDYGLPTGLGLPGILVGPIDRLDGWESGGK
jgi:hypothetical protein